MTLLSVLTPSYDYAHFLPQCLASVDEVAAGGGVEHVVVDDASTDNSVEIVSASLATSPWRSLDVHPVNRGLSATLNTALGLASGTWIGWLNADDAYEPAGLATVLATLPALPADVAMVYGDVRLLDATGRRTGVLPLYRGAPWCLRQGYNPFLVPSVLLRRSALPGFDEAFRLLMDMDAYLGVLRHGRAGYLPVVIGQWRRHPTQLCENPRPTDAAEWRYLGEKHDCRFRRGPTRRGRGVQRVLKVVQGKY